jgi:hypothetical protein
MEAQQTNQEYLKYSRLARTTASLILSAGVFVPIESSASNSQVESLSSIPLVSESLQAREPVTPMEIRLPDSAGGVRLRKSLQQLALSTTWTGYGVNARSGQFFNQVSAEFMVPRLSCPTSPPKGDGYQYDLGGSFWVGINGFPNNNPKTPAIEQDGLDFFCSGYNEATGHQNANYFMFYEPWPSSSTPVLTAEPVSVGDTIEAEVDYSDGSYYFNIEDLNIGEGFNSPPTACPIPPGDTTSQPCTNTYVEYIAENQTPGELGLADFHRVQFTDATASTTEETTVSTNGPIPLGDYIITNPTTKIVFALEPQGFMQTGPVAHRGDSFGVKWGS